MDLAHLIRQRMNKVFRENLDYLFERFESQDLCSIVVSTHKYESSAIIKRDLALLHLLIALIGH